MRFPFRIVLSVMFLLLRSCKVVRGHVVSALVASHTFLGASHIFLFFTFSSGVGWLHDKKRLIIRKR